MRQEIDDIDNGDLDRILAHHGEERLAALEKTYQGRGFTQRRNAAIIAVLTATGIRAAELAGIRYDPLDPRRSGYDGSIWDQVQIW